MYSVCGYEFETPDRLFFFNCFQGYHNTVPNKRFAQAVFD